MSNLTAKTNEKWICPNCGIQLKDLEDLINMKDPGYQDMPDIGWCTQCGTIRDFNSPEKHTHIPALFAENTTLSDK